MPATLPPSTDRPHLHWLDWLRFLAAFVVLLDHTWGFHWAGFTRFADSGDSWVLAVLIPLCSMGRQAVVVFFVLSGWLVGGSAWVRVRASTFDAAAYTADRLARVYVPLLPALLLTMALVRGLDGNVDLREYGICLVGLQDISGIHKPVFNAPLWSLGFEIWFYVLAGAVALACRRGGVGWARLAAATTAVAAIWVCVGLGWTYLACWLAGVAGPCLRERLTPAVRPWTAAMGAATMVAGVLISQCDEGILPPPGGLPLPTINAAQGIVAAGTLLFAASVADLSPRSRTGRRVERAGTVLAAFSYTLYLVHFPILFTLRFCLGPSPAEWTAPAACRALGWGAVCVAVALVMYALFERQTPRVRRWLRARFGGEAPSRLAPALDSGDGSGSEASPARMIRA